jgi:hypothetical protein
MQYDPGIGVGVFDVDTGALIEFVQLPSGW